MRNKRGPKPKPVAEKLSETIQVPFVPSDAETVTFHADLEGMTPAAFIRRVVKDYLGDIDSAESGE